MNLRAGISLQSGDAENNETYYIRKMWKWLKVTHLNAQIIINLEFVLILCSRRNSIVPILPYRL